MEALKAIVAGTRVVRLIDRDDHSDQDVIEKLAQGLRVLSRRHLESYLFDEEVLATLCNDLGRPDIVPQLTSEKHKLLQQRASEGRAPDDVKAASGLIFVACKKLLNISQGGNTPQAFMRNMLAPRIKPGMAVYNELRQAIFGTTP